MKSNFLLGAVLVLLTISCQNGSNADQKAASDSSKMVAKASPVPAKPANVMAIWQKVSNFDKWLVGYEAHDSARLASGLHNYVIGREIDNPNMVLVAVKMDDPAKAKAFAASPDLKAAMKKGGVMGTPSITFRDVQMSDTNSKSSPVRLMVQHKVKDYDAWKKEFDSHSQARMDAGLTTRSMSYSLDDKNDVSVVFYVEDLKKAKAFIESKDLKDKMAASGVIGMPVIHFYNVVKKY